MRESYEKGLADHSAPNPTRVAVTSLVLHGQGVHAGQPLSSEISHFACRPCLIVGKATCDAPLTGGRATTRRRRQGAPRRGGVEDPVHVWKLQTREPGDPMRFLITGGTVGEGQWPYVRHERAWEVRWSHSTCEAGEQSRNPGRGARGGKGITQGKVTPIFSLRTPNRTMRGWLEMATAGRDVVILTVIPKGGAV